MPESQRLRALLYAGVICERLAQWGAVWSHEEQPKQPALRVPDPAADSS